MIKDTKKIVKIFKALSDENRLKILLSTYKQECKCGDLKSCNKNNCICVKDLSRPLRISIPTVSHHIKELVNADLITTRKEGRWVYCRINKKAIGNIREFLDNFSKDKGRGRKK